MKDGDLWQCSDMDLPDIVLFRCALAEVGDCEQSVRKLLDALGDEHEAGILFRRKLFNAKAMLEKINERVVTAQSQARTVDETVRALEGKSWATQPK